MYRRKSSFSADWLEPQTFQPGAGALPPERGGGTREVLQDHENLGGQSGV